LKIQITHTTMGVIDAISTISTILTSQALGELWFSYEA
jgi:hypothetical protein